MKKCIICNAEKDDEFNTEYVINCLKPNSIL